MQFLPAWVKFSDFEQAKCALSCPTFSWSLDVKSSLELVLDSTTGATGLDANPRAEM